MRQGQKNKHFQPIKQSSRRKQENKIKIKRINERKNYTKLQIGEEKMNFIAQHEITRRK